MRDFIVYKHTSPSGKVYIGITSYTLEERAGKDGHSYKSQIYFYRAIQKYGWDNFKHEIIADGLTKEEACDLEKFLIWRYNSTNPKKGYNLSLGGECGTFGVVVSEETRRKISKATKGEKNGFYGQKHTEETRKKMRENHADFRGEKSPLYGKHLSEEHRRKISEANKGKPSHRKGKRHTEETLKKLSKAAKGRISIKRKPVMCIETGEIFSHALEAAKSVGLKDAEYIRRACIGMSKTSGGYHWRYV